MSVIIVVEEFGVDDLDVLKVICCYILGVVFMDFLFCLIFVVDVLEFIRGNGLEIEKLC